MSDLLPSAETFATFSGRTNHDIGTQVAVGNGEVMYVVSKHYYLDTDSTRLGLSYINPAVPR